MMMIGARQLRDKNYDEDDDYNDDDCGAFFLAMGAHADIYAEISRGLISGGSFHLNPFYAKTKTGKNTKTKNQLWRKRFAAREKTGVMMVR